MRHTFRYVVPVVPAAGADLSLDEAASHHLARVVRRRPGDTVEVIAPSGEIWSCEVLDPGPPAVLRMGAAPRPAPVVPPVDLWVGLCDASRLEMLAGKAAELGVRSLTVMGTARARRVPDARSWARRAERMARVAEAAARQSGRGAWPAPGPLVPLDDVLTQIAPEQGIILDPRAAVPLADLMRTRPATEPVSILVGPDTGFDEAEVDQVVAHGLAAAVLIPGMLRAETAAIAAAVVAIAVRGTAGEG